MTAIVIGEPYPAELVLRNAAALLVGDGLTLLVHMDRLGLPDHDFAETPGDIDAFRGEVRIHVARFHAFPWVAVEFPLTRLVYDTPLVVGHDNECRNDLDQILRESSNRLVIYLLEGEDYRVRVIRILGLSHEVVAALAPAMAQTQDEGRLSEGIELGQRWFPHSQAVVDMATVHQVFPWQ